MCAGEGEAVSGESRDKGEKEEKEEERWAIMKDNW